jgi:hypothetical protein
MTIKRRSNKQDVDNEYNNENVDERRKFLGTNVQLGKMNWIKHHSNEFAGFLDKLQSIKTNDGSHNTEENNSVEKRETMANGLASNPNPSLYPGVVTKSIDLNGFQPNSINHNLNIPQPLSVYKSNNAATGGGWGDATTINYNGILNQLKNLNINTEQIARKNTNEYLYPNMNINNDDDHSAVEKKNGNNGRNVTNTNDNNGELIAPTIICFLVRRSNYNFIMLFSD